MTRTFRAERVIFIDPVRTDREVHSAGLTACDLAAVFKGRRQGVSPACSPTGGGPARTGAGEKSPVTGDCHGRDPREPGAAMPSATQPGGHLN